MDYEERITAAELGQGEGRSESTLRPQTLQDYIGQKEIWRQYSQILMKMMCFLLMRYID